MIKFHKVKTPELEYCYTEPSDLMEDEKEEIPSIIDECWYWYQEGSWEGSGHMVFTIGDKWYMHDMGHCSCYGPTDNINTEGGYDSIEDLKNACSESLRKEMSTIFDAIQ